MQYTKCLGMQYLEAIRNLRDQGFVPLRSVYITFVPDEEVGGGDVFQRLITSTEFQALNVGVAVIEGESSDNSNYRVFHGERTPWSLVIKALGDSGLGSKLYEQSAIESLVKSMEAISRFRASQFDLLKAGLKPEGGIVTVNPVYLKAGSPSHTVRAFSQMSLHSICMQICSCGGLFAVCFECKEEILREKKRSLEELLCDVKHHHLSCMG